jgi:hypothetical protein
LRVVSFKRISRFPNLVFHTYTSVVNLDLIRMLLGHKPPALWFLEG